MRFTIGQIPVPFRSTPAINPTMPANASHLIFPRGSRSPRRTFPASRPRIIVASVGTKTGASAVAAPPAAVKGCSRRNRVQKTNCQKPRRDLHVFIPMRGKPSEQIRPTRRYSRFAPVKTRSRLRIESKRQPVDRQYYRESHPLKPPRTERDHVEEAVAETNLSQCVLKSPVGLRAAQRPQEHAQQHQNQCPPKRVQGTLEFRLAVGRAPRDGERQRHPHQE